MKNLTDRNEPDRTKSMFISSRTVLTPEKSITHENCPEIEKSIQAAIEQDKTEVILDCKNVELLDSAALELLNQIHYDLSKRRGALKLLGLNPVCRDILAATRIDNVLLIYKDIHEAIRNIS